MSFLKNKSKAFKVTSAVLLALVIVIGSSLVYLCDYYRADEGAVAVFGAEENITVSVRDGNVIFEPQNATRALIFYPGGKVEHHAYEPLLAELARDGVLCVLVKMPFNLAVFDINAAEGIREQYPEIKEWYIGGHSLGGSMAASYLAKNVEDYEGLILLASYSTADLSDFDLDVISIYGSEDEVLNREKYEENKANLPANFTETVIEGGCHAYFGMYGAQDGDGTPTISNSEQISVSADAILEFMK